MEKLSSIFGAIVAAIGGVIGWIWGDFTPLLAALIVCMVLDYISGVACAVVRKDVSSEIGFKGIVKKNRDFNARRRCTRFRRSCTE